SLKSAWKAKAAQLARGRKYETTKLVFRALESTSYVYTGVFLTFPITSKNHSVFGTLTF
ncbi:MAG: hypothetical protein H7Y36_09410, partial [Armatimonadetes bacterium]|nr:hypothetical protein [Akkermansiaceae bacterium]